MDVWVRPLVLQLWGPHGFGLLCQLCQLGLGEGSTRLFRVAADQLGRLTVLSDTPPSTTSVAPTT